VHLSETEEEALYIGKRHGTPVVLKINAEQMFHDEYKFYLSRNGVWLTEFVSAEYIEVMN
jgi:putative RNA 2'-phosphotransferase